MINKVQLWIDNWHLSLNVDKCVTVCYGRNVDSSRTHLLCYTKPWLDPS